MSTKRFCSNRQKTLPRQNSIRGKCGPGSQGRWSLWRLIRTFGEVGIGLQPHSVGAHSGCMDDAHPKKIKLRAAMHGAFDELQPVAGYATKTTVVWLCFCLPDGRLGSTLAIASAAEDSPFLRGSTEVERSFRYQRASGGAEAGSSSSSTEPMDSTLHAAGWRRKSTASRRSPPTQRATNAMRRSASRFPLGPSSTNSRQPVFRYRRPSAVILWFVRPHGPGFPGQPTYLQEVSARQRSSRRRESCGRLQFAGSRNPVIDLCEYKVARVEDAQSPRWRRSNTRNVQRE